MHARVSLCMIAKNEETNLPACIQPLADLVHETIVVDTGSVDRTKEVAKALGAHVFDFPWIDDFSAARNESVRHATGAWIFWMDADDRIDEMNRQRLASLFGQLGDENAAYLMKCQGAANAATGAAGVTEHVRLFRNHPEALWRHRIHEQILPALSRLGTELRPTDVTIQHTGYLDPALRARKAERNLRLLEREAAENPGEPHALFYLGQTHLMLGAAARAVPLLQACLKLSNPHDPLTTPLYVLLTQALHQSGAPREAFAICQAGRTYFPTSPDLLFLEGISRQLGGDSAGAVSCFQQLLTNPNRSGSMDTSMFFKARHRLALEYVKGRRLDEAEAQWRAVLTENPLFLQAWLGLADICLTRGEAGARTQLLEAMATVPGNDLNRALVAGRFHEADRNYPAARRVLEEACAAHRQALWPRVALAQILLQEGQDWRAAEHALCAILELDPNHTETHRNLELVRQRRGTGP